MTVLQGKVLLSAVHNSMLLWYTHDFSAMHGVPLGQQGTFILFSDDGDALLFFIVMLLNGCIQWGSVSVHLLCWCIYLHL
jgi:hypothetical protein